MSTQKTPVRSFSLRRAALLGALAAVAAWALPASAASAAAPVWKLTVASNPTNFAPGSAPGFFSPFPQYLILATNIGSATTSGPATITDTLPAGVTPVEPVVKIVTRNEQNQEIAEEFPCEASGQAVTCNGINAVSPGAYAQVTIPLEVEGEPGVPPSVTDEASISGGGASEAVARATTKIDTAVAPFDFNSGSAGLSLALTQSNGAPATEAGSHPNQLTIDTGFPTALIGSFFKTLISAGHLHDLRVNLPRGVVVNPQATPVLCTAAQLESETCPDASAIGTVSVLTIISGPAIVQSALYNMVPPAGTAAHFGFTGPGTIKVHIIGGVNSAGEYELGAESSDILARSLNPILGVQTVLWGNPSDPSHDALRGECVSASGRTCKLAERTNTPLLTMPSSCRPSLTANAIADPWENPSQDVSRSAQVEDPGTGASTGTDGCNQLKFDPAIEAKPTTNLSDAPTGLNFKLHVPQATLEQSPGKTNICTPGSWENEPTSFSYQWLRNGAPIPGATSPTYVTQAEDAASLLQCEIAASNAAVGPGFAASLPSIVQPAPSTAPPSPAIPTIGGPVINSAGGSVKCEPGAWGGEPTFTFQWFKNGSPVPGQTAETYVAAPGEAPMTLQCEVKGSNAGGIAVAFSENRNSQPALEPALPSFKTLPETYLPESELPLATANLKDAKVTLPAGVSVNPSGANGLSVCTPAQFGLTSAVGQTPVRTDAAPAHCPDAAKLGNLEVNTQLLDHPVLGAIYAAQPYQNPFNSLLAIYLAIYDEETGTVIKLAGKVEADPNTGQITGTFEDNPELPFEDFKLHFFGGPQAALKTPLACGIHTTTSVFTPWSAPEGADATPSDSFPTSVAQGGGACPTSEATAPNHPSFNAGTIARQAGAYSPFVLKLSREDGTQRLTGIDITLPKGLIAKLAGLSYCSEAQIAAAKSREAPSQGAIEQQNPSCPLASEVGTVTAGVGAGITPYYAQGHAYLAGPYKGAPLSLVVISPAVAGPYDLGSVVNRTALYVNSETAQVHAVSDPLPTILQGVPLDIRSIALKMDRPNFTLNPTSCNPMAVTGSATAATGQSALLNDPFQVGGCNALKFAPRLSLSLKGGTRRTKHPALRAVLNYPKGSYANIARAQVTLPHSEFLDQAHIGTICTRVQFAANTCPKASVYGFARAFTPLLDKPVEGPVYLRSSSHKLPDLVAALDGQIDVDVAGRIDTGKNGGIRSTFEAVPDAPVSKFVLEMRGGKKGLLINSENICSKPQRAIADFTAQNGKLSNTKPLIANSCKGKKKHKTR